MSNGRMLVESERGLTHPFNDDLWDVSEQCYTVLVHCLAEALLILGITRFFSFRKAPNQEELFQHLIYVLKLQDAICLKCLYFYFLITFTGVYLQVIDWVLEKNKEK